MTADLEQQLAALDAEILALGAPAFDYQILARPHLARERNERMREWREKNPVKAEQRDALLARQGTLQAKIDATRWAEGTRSLSFERLLNLGVQRVHVDFARKPADVPAMKGAREWWPSSDWSLALLGGVGAAKTSSAAWLALQALTESKSLRWLRAQEACRHPLFGAEAEAWTARARTVDVLVLDDLGSDAVTDHWAAWLGDVLDARWGNGRRTIITCNLDLEHFRARVGPRLYDRLRTGRVFGCGDTSLRQRRAS